MDDGPYYVYYDEDHTYPKWALFKFGWFDKTKGGIRWWTDNEIWADTMYWSEIEREYKKNNPKLTDYQARKLFFPRAMELKKQRSKHLDRETVLAKVDIQTLLENYGVRLRKVGNKFIALCPFHKDCNASLSVWPDKKRWWCFSCNFGGSSIDWIMKMENLDFKASLERLDSIF